jgi:hypothetical protein
LGIYAGGPAVDELPEPARFDVRGVVETALVEALAL